MTTSPSPNRYQSFDFWAFDFPVPQPTQDAELLRQLGFIPGLKELLMLRQVHALEHATVWMLSELLDPPRPGAAQAADNQRFGGMSTDEGFYLYGDVSLADLNRAVRLALQRITTGEWGLAVHPRCGTNLSVGMLLTAGLALGAHLLLPRGPIEQMLGVGVAATTAAHLAPELGSVAQRYLTTAIPFNLVVDAIAEVPAAERHRLKLELLQDGEQSCPVHFVRVRWRD